jgi:hypothetical protein
MAQRARKPGRNRSNCMTETTESAGPDPKRVGGPQGLLAPALLLAFLLVMLAPSMFLAASRLPSPWSLWLGALVSLLLPLNLLLSSALALMGLLVYAGPLIGSRRFDRAEALRSRQGEDRPEWARLPEAAAKGGVAVLIHGTFARKNSWTLPDAPLPQALRASGLTVATFSWTDANSMRSRRIAVERLRRYIGELTAAGFGSVALVGHSHAGNIALKACEEPQTAARVKAIACLSTPFIEAWRPRVRVIHGWAHAGLYLVAACAGGFLMLLPGALLTSLDDAFTPRLLAAELCCVGLATLVGVTGVRIVRQVSWPAMAAAWGRTLTWPARFAVLRPCRRCAAAA